MKSRTFSSRCTTSSTCGCIGWWCGWAILVQELKRCLLLDVGPWRNVLVDNHATFQSYRGFLSKLPLNVFDPRRLFSNKLRMFVTVTRGFWWFWRCYWSSSKAPNVEHSLKGTKARLIGEEFGRKRLHKLLNVANGKTGAIWVPGNNFLVVMIWIVWVLEEFVEFVGKVARTAKLGILWFRFRTVCSCWSWSFSFGCRFAFALHLYREGGNSGALSFQIQHGDHVGVDWDCDCIQYFYRCCCCGGIQRTFLVDSLTPTTLLLDSHGREAALASPMMPIVCLLLELQYEWLITSLTTLSET